jgi:hypothetical protein
MYARFAHETATNDQTNNKQRTSKIKQKQEANKQQQNIK